MAVVPRKRKSGTVYYAVNAWHGRQVAELIGPSKRDAEIRDRAMKREIEAGTYQPPQHRKAVTLAEYAEMWAAPRKNASAKDERALLRLYVLPRRWLAGKRLDEVAPSDIARLVSELKAETDAAGERRLSDKTIANAVGVLRQIFGQAIREDRATRQPVTLAPGTLRRRRAEEPESYTAAEALVLTRHTIIPWPIRVLNALCLFAGLREGEACGRRWRDLDDGPRPLPKLLVRDQYDGRPLKTDRPRAVPVHPELARVLTEWARDGFELHMRRKPEPDDFIVPTTGYRALRPGSNYTRSSYYKAFVRSAEAAGVRPRSLHATRHTFITLCRRGGARKDVLERVTHNAAGDIVDGYTHFDWAPLCEAVLCLNLDVHPTVHPVIGSGGDSGGGPEGGGTGHEPTNRGNGAPVGLVRFPAPPQKTEPKKAGFENSTQEFSQESTWVLEYSRAQNRKRKRRLLALEQADREAAIPGLAVCRALDAVLDGDVPAAVAQLKAASEGRGRRGS